MLNREGPTAPYASSEVADKVERLLKKLEEHLEFLAQYRKKIQMRSGEG